MNHTISFSPSSLSSPFSGSYGFSPGPDCVHRCRRDLPASPSSATSRSSRRTSTPTSRVSPENMVPSSNSASAPSSPSSSPRRRRPGRSSRPMTSSFANHDVPVAGRVNTYGGVDILWSPYGQEWRMLRKVCVSRMLSSATLDSFYTLRRAEIRRTVRFLADRGRSGSPVNLREQIFMTILNVILQMLWGATVADEERESVGAEFRALISEMTDIVGIPDISDFFPILSRFDLQGLVKRMREPAQRLDRLFDRVINQRLRVDKRNQVDGQDFLKFLLKVREEDQNTPLSMDHVKAVLTDMVLGGVDTSSKTIEYAMTELMRRPEMMKRAQQELDEAVGKDNIVEESHITKLPYLSAVMKETLRVHPIFPLLIPHRSSESAIVSGYTIPKHTKVFINVWAIHRDPKSWEDPLEFNPSRFLGSTGDFTGNNFSYLPFGSGRRICAGIAMAERVVLYKLATLLHSFDWKVPEGERCEMREKFGSSMKLKDPILAVPVPRLSELNLYL